MARPTMSHDEEERIRERLKLGRDAMKGPSELDQFRAAGDAHPFAKPKKPFVPRKAEEDKLIKKQVRLHKKMITAVERYASEDQKDFSEAVRALLSDSLKRYGVVI